MRDYFAQPTLSLATARAAVCDPDNAANRWEVRDAWFLLKEAQGHPISRERVMLLHLSSGTSPAGRARVAAITDDNAEPHIAVQLAPHLARSAQAVRAIIARSTGPTGGGAA